MATTISVMKKGQIVLPKTLCDAIKIGEGAPLRAVARKGSILLTPIRPARSIDYETILKAAGQPLAKEPPGAVKRIKAAIQRVGANDRRA